MGKSARVPRTKVVNSGESIRFLDDHLPDIDRRSCPNNVRAQCGFFEWADDATPPPPDRFASERRGSSRSAKGASARGRGKAKGTGEGGPGGESFYEVGSLQHVSNAVKRVTGRARVRMKRVREGIVMLAEAPRPEVEGLREGEAVVGQASEVDQAVMTSVTSAEARVIGHQPVQVRANSEQKFKHQACIVNKA